MIRIVIFNLYNFDKEVYDSSISETPETVKKNKAKKTYPPTRTKKKPQNSRTVAKTSKFRASKNKTDTVTKTEEEIMETPARLRARKRQRDLCELRKSRKSMWTLYQEKHMQSDVAVPSRKSRMSMRQVQRISKRKSRRVQKVDDKTVRRRLR